MLDQEQSQTNPLGPLASAAQLVPQNGDSIKPPIRNPMLSETNAVAAVATDPDTDGRRSYSPGYGASFAAAQPAAKTPADGNPLAETIQPRAAQVQTAAGNPLAAAVGRDASGIITADSALAASGNPMAREGGIYGTTDMKGVNDIMARENAIRQSMIDPQRTDNKPGGGVAVLGSTADTDALNADRTARWNSEAMVNSLKGTGRAGNAMAQVMAASANGQNNLAAERMRQETAMAGGVPVGRQREAGNPLVDELNRTKVQAGQIENQQSQRLNDLQRQLVAETDPAKQAAISAQIKALSGGSGQSRQDGTLTMPQRRSNFEIEAARKTVEGLTAEEIKRKTAKTTNTGRENPDFDPTLERAVNLAGRRMYGTDDHFDQRQNQGQQAGQQTEQPAGTDGDALTRFRADKAMGGHTTGKVTEKGVEVFDASGRLVGHYS